MGQPNPHGSFAAGFTQGLANVLGQQQENEARKKEQWRQMQMLGVKQALETGQIGVENLPDIINFIHGDEPGKTPKVQKGQVDTRHIASSVLSQVIGQSGSMTDRDAAATVTGGGTPIPTGTTPLKALAPDVGGVATQQPAPEGRSGGTSWGVPIRTEQEAAVHQQAVKSSVLNMAVEALLKTDPNMTRTEAVQMAMGHNLPSDGSSMAGNMGRYGGTVQGNKLPTGTMDVNGKPVDPNGFYRTQIRGDGSNDYFPTIAPSTAGVNLNAAAVSMGYQSATEVPPEKRAELVQKANALVGGTAQARVEGAGQGAMNVPIDVAGSQTTGAVIGTTSNQYLGQTAPTQEQLTQGRTGEVLLSDIAHLVGEGGQPSLLDVLPTEKDMLGQTIPGAVMAARRVSRRKEMDALSSVVDQMVNDLARYRGQRGAQTEPDVARAYNSLVKLNGGLLNPTSGSTQESARAAIEEARLGLERVAKTMVPKLSPTQASSAPTTGAPGGFSTIYQGQVFNFDTQAKLDLFKRAYGIP